MSKQELKEAYLQGYELGKGVEQMEEVSLKAAETEFEQWYTNNRGETNE